MKQRIVRIIEKVAKIIIFLTGEAIKVAFLALAFGFYLEGKRLEMWIYIFSGYIFQIIFYKLFLIPYISPIPEEKSKK